MTKKMIALMITLIVLSTGMQVFADSAADAEIQEPDSKIIELEEDTMISDTFLNAGFILIGMRR